MLKELRENPRALMYAVLMHLLLIVALFVSVDWKTRSSGGGQGAPIKAQVVDNAKVQAEVAKLKQAQEQKQRQEEARKTELERAAQQAEQRRVQEERRLEELQQKKLEEQQNLKKLEQQRVVEQKAEAQRQAKLKAQQQAAQEKKARAAAETKRKQAEAKKKTAEEKKARAATEAKRQAEAERALQEQLAAEESSLQAGRNSDIVDQYIAGIQQAVQNNWLRPASAHAGMSCVVLVNLIPGGDVVGVRVVESSGDAAFDRSVENAVRKAAPLPLPPDPSLFDNFRELRFIFKPET